MQVAINGMGRIGRAVFRNLYERGNAECVLINDALLEIDNIIYLLKYDTIYGRFPGNVEKYGDNCIRIINQEKEWNVKVLHSANIKEFAEFISNCDIVIDATGNDECARASKEMIHEGGAKYVIITNTFFDADFTLVMGHNDNELDLSKHRVISTSICDANATIPLLSKLFEKWEIEHCFVTTLHPWLSYQNLMDGAVRMQRRPGETMDYYPLGRSSIGNLIPKTTTLGMVLTTIFPQLDGNLSFLSYRVPTQIVASADMSIVLKNKITQEELTETFRNCNSEIVHCSRDNFISCDCIKTEYSSIVDWRWTQVDSGNMLKIVTWYDNEWGYSSRVIDLVNKIQGRK